jgi:hypothetical protein
VARMREGQARRALRDLLRRLQGVQADHHASGYPPAVARALPLGAGTPPSLMASLAMQSGWVAPRLERLVEVEWARWLGMGRAERLLGVMACYAVVASAPADKEAR